MVSEYLGSAPPGLRRLTADSRTVRQRLLTAGDGAARRCARYAPASRPEAYGEIPSTLNLSPDSRIIRRVNLLFVLCRLLSNAVFLHSVDQRLAADVQVFGGMSLVAVELIQSAED